MLWICRLSAFRPSVLQRKSCVCEPQWLVLESPITTSPSDSIAATKRTPVKQCLEMSPSGLQKWKMWGSRWDEWNEVEETPLRQQNTTLRKQVCHLQHLQRIKFPAFFIFALPWIFGFVSDFNFLFFFAIQPYKQFPGWSAHAPSPEITSPYPEWSWTRNLPLDAPISPVSILKMVVFPAPFTPSRPKHWVVEKKGRNVTTLYL